MMIKHAITLLGLIGISVMMMAEGTFRICTYNIDGLPPKILGYECNMQGPQEVWTKKIAECLLADEYDIIGVQEDFNYHKQLTSVLSDMYSFSTFRGKVSATAALISGGRADTDGLCLLTKKALTVRQERIVEWKDYSGFLNHDNDGFARKGFRAYTIALPFGAEIDVYVLHADAGFEQEDIDARGNQFRQLVDYILNADSQRPMIIMGDMNSIYERNPFKAWLIDGLEASGHLTCSDVCIDLLNNGSYPEYAEESSGYCANGEDLDKIIIVNDDRAAWELQGMKYERPTTFVRDDGSQLSDHRPTVAQVKAVKREASAIVDVTPHKSVTYYTIDGRPARKGEKGVFKRKIKNEE